MAHVDPWVLCKADIEELEREIERLEKLNAEDEITASNLEAQADGLTAIIGPLTSASVQNEVDIGTLGSTESTQQGDIDQLLDDVATTTVDIQNNLGSLEIMQMVINALPTASDFQMRLMTLETAVNNLVIAQAATRAALGTAQGDLSTQQGAVMTADTAVTNLNSAVASIATDITTNETDLGILEGRIDMVEASIEDLEPEADIFVTNASLITWNTGNNDLISTPDS